MTCPVCDAMPSKDKGARCSLHGGGLTNEEWATESRLSLEYTVRGNEWVKMTPDERRMLERLRPKLRGRDDPVDPESPHDHWLIENDRTDQVPVKTENSTEASRKLAAALYEAFKSNEHSFGYVDDGTLDHEPPLSDVILDGRFDLQEIAAFALNILIRDTRQIEEEQ